MARVQVYAENSEPDDGADEQDHIEDPVYAEVVDAAEQVLQVALVLAGQAELQQEEGGEEVDLGQSSLRRRFVW